MTFLVRSIVAYAELSTSKRIVAQHIRANVVGMKPHSRTAPAAKAAGGDSPNLGAALRQLRFQRRLSIADVSEATGIAKSTLSRVENDQLSLTYSKLLQLCRGLQIDIAQLFSSQEHAAEVRPSARRTFTPPGAGRPVVVGRQGYAYLCTELAGKKMTPMIGIITSRTLAESNGLLKHAGEEFAYVLEGQLELHTEYYSPLLLDTGGCVYFDGTMGHAYVSVGDKPLKILCVCSTPDQILEHSFQPDKPTRQAPALVDPAPRPRLRRTRRA
jgi:transcriptional regulator with XRE-family HTH domain